MSTHTSASANFHSTISLGLAFLFTGVGFALPFWLFGSLDFATQMARAPEVLNLFCLVAWMGLSHFFFAYRGHLQSSRKSRSLFFYCGIFIASLLVLFLLRHYIGIAIFSAVAWIYFISHLIKAEMFFANEKDWQLYSLPLTAFTYFSFALLAPEDWITPWTILLGAVFAFLPLAFPRSRVLIRRGFFWPLFLVATFLIGEGLIWGKYRADMSPGFRDGVYTVHVALASFYHYFRSYFYMKARGQGGLGQMLLVNIIVIALGVLAVQYAPESHFILLLGPQYFTVWVWQHQWMSDVFNWRKGK